MIKLIRAIHYRIRELLITYKQGLSKIKKSALSPLMGVLILQENTTKKNNPFPSKLELSPLDIFTFYSRRIRILFTNLDLDRNELNKVKQAMRKCAWLNACEALIDYYRVGKIAITNTSTTDIPSTSTVLSGEAILQNTFSFQSTTGLIERHQNGLLNWTSKGPNDDLEWAWFLNRHYHLLDLFYAYQETGNSAYVRCLNDQVIDWILSSPSSCSPEIWAQWRGLEVAFRVIHWSQIFYGLQQVEEFTSAARILMLSSILDHAYYLRYLNSWGANWLVKEMCGLATIALCWPEFKNSRRWLAYASNRLIHELTEQVYPDGVHKELTSHYHRAVLMDLQDLADLLLRFGREVPDHLTKTLERMWNYLAYSLRPDGHGTLNNDSDRNDNRSLVNQAADTYQRPDWAYIATNGKAGQRPKGLPSRVFPWAGQVIMRSGWDPKAHWAFFDIGPLGIYYHIHNDKLHLSLAAYGRDLLVDSGRYSYVRNKFWRYFRGSASHNVVLVDGQGQKSDARESLQPMVGNYVIEPEFDFARGTFNRGFITIKGKATHTRAVVYLRGKYWVVVDQITTDRPRQIEPLWHFHPGCTVIFEGDSVTSIDSDVGNLRIIPCANLSWSVNLVQGQEDPVQGWWSGTYNQKVPSLTAIYSTQINQSTTFAWLLLPAQGLVPKPAVTLLPAPEGAVLLRIQTPEQSPDIISVRIAGHTPIDLSEDLQLDGDCAILRPGKQPLVAYGAITDATGKVIAEHGGSSSRQSAATNWRY